MAGKDYGFWHVVEFRGRGRKRSMMWLCRCVCGLERVMAGHHLRHGASKSCGCKTFELRSHRNQGENHGAWKGGRKITGSEAWCNERAGRLRYFARMNGHPPIISTGADIKAAWDAGGGKCAACGWEFCGAGKIHADHDHAKGLFRGFLCGPCNISIGISKESPERLRSCAGYLERNRQ